MTISPPKKYPTIGACGLDCVLCPRHYTEGRSRCAGCGSENSFAVIGCKVFRCCVKDNELGTCAECRDFPCQKLEGADSADSFVTHRKMMFNLHSLRDHGIEAFLEEQRTRHGLLESMLDEYNDGRSKGFFCSAATLLPIKTIVDSIEGAKKGASEDGIKDEDKKARAKALKSRLDAAALAESIDLGLRRSGLKR